MRAINKKTRKNTKSLITKLFMHHDVKVRLFNILALGGMFTCVVVFIYNIVYTDMRSVSIITCLFILSAALLTYAQKTGNYKPCYIITVICIFLIGFPMLFFANGGYHGGMPATFVFAVVFTVLMLDRKYGILVALFELAFYISLCIIAYVYPQTVTYFSTEFSIMVDVAMAFTISSIVCAGCLYLHLQEYDVQQQKLVVQNEHLKMYNDAKSTFLTTVAHEIRNPLTAISANARDTKERLEDDEQEGLNTNLETIENIVMRIDRILTDLMDTVSIEQGKFTVCKAPVKLEAVLREAADNFTKDIQRTNNTIEIRTPPLEPIMADHERLLQVMNNLLSNAIKHTRNGTIVLSLNQEDGYQTVNVIDTGGGMEKTVRDKVFKGYVSMSKEYWRHGIGLYVCHQIISAHNGEIFVGDTGGKGTKITFNLPFETE